MVIGFQGIQLWEVDAILTMDLAPCNAGVLLVLSAYLWGRSSIIEIEHVYFTWAKFS